MSFDGKGTLASQLLEEIVAQIPRLPLVHQPEQQVTEIWSRLQTVSDEDLLGARIANPAMATAVRSGLLVRAGFFDEAHELCQDLPSREGSYWHGILHRLEPDAANAKYWFRKVGDHPLYADLPGDEAREAMSDPDLAALTAKGRWDPFVFIDLCAGSIGKRPELRGSLEYLQGTEINALLAYCFASALA